MTEARSKGVDAPPGPAEAVAPAAEEASRGPTLGRKIRRWAMDLALLVGIYLAVTTWQERNLLARHAVAPDLALRSLDGRTVSLAELRGKRVLLHFWATWCGVCEADRPALNAVQARLGPDEILLSVVADADDPSHVRRYVEREHVAFPVLLGTDEVLRAFRVGAFPTNYFIDSHGRIAGHTIGMSTRFSIAARLALLD